MSAVPPFPAPRLHLLSRLLRRPPPRRPLRPLRGHRRGRGIGGAEGIGSPQSATEAVGGCHPPPPDGAGDFPFLRGRRFFCAGVLSNLRKKRDVRLTAGRAGRGRFAREACRERRRAKASQTVGLCVLAWCPARTTARLLRHSGCQVC